MSLICGISGGMTLWIIIKSLDVLSVIFWNHPVGNTNISKNLFDILKDIVYIIVVDVNDMKSFKFFGKEKKITPIGILNGIHNHGLEEDETRPHYQSHRLNDHFSHMKYISYDVINTIREYNLVIVYGVVIDGVCHILSDEEDIFPDHWNEYENYNYEIMVLPFTAGEDPHEDYWMHDIEREENFARLYGEEIEEPPQIDMDNLMDIITSLRNNVRDNEQLNIE
jgi:hypothetical protein